MFRVCLTYAAKVPVFGLIALSLFFPLAANLSNVSAQTLLVQNDPVKHETIVKPQVPAEAAVADQFQQKQATPETVTAPATPAAAAEEKSQKEESDSGEAPDATEIGGVDPKAISAGPTLLFDAVTGEVLSERRAGETWYPASLTKVMTAYVVLRKIKAGTMRLDQQLEVSKLAARQPASRVGMPAGSKVTVEKALAALLIYSANDMAYVLAEGASGSIRAFANDMNAAAQALGMSSSYFVNPNGLYDPRQITTARDLGILARAMISEFPDASRFYGAESVDMGRRRLFNRNTLIRLMPDADGMKTGFVCDSGFNLIATAKRAERRLVAVILGTRSGYARAVLAKDMLEQGFATAQLPQAEKVFEIVNQPIGLFEPFDMTRTVCRNKDVAEVIDPTLLSGWGVSFAAQPTAPLADDMLHRNMLMAAGLAAPGYGATYRLADKSGFVPMLWGMDEASARKACDTYRYGGIACTVLGDYVLQFYGQIHAARLQKAKSSKAKAPAVTQGSDTGQAKKKPAASSKKGRPVTRKKSRSSQKSN